MKPKKPTPKPSVRKKSPNISTLYREWELEQKVVEAGISYVKMAPKGLQAGLNAARNLRIVVEALLEFRRKK